MNTKSLLITVLATAFAGAASATSKTPAELQQEAQLRAPSTITRAEVMAEVLKARHNGTLITDSELRWSQPTAESSTSTFRRADVRADVAAAIARGERLSQGDTNRNSPSVHTPHDARGQTTVALRDAATGK